jgi:hypothetical protein
MPVHNMKTYRGSRGIVPLLTPAPDGGEWLTLRPDHFTAKKELRFPLNRWLNRRASPDIFLKQKNLLPLPGFETRIVQPVA